MEVNYRIISKDEENHSIVVRYFTDILTEDHLASSFDGAGNIIYDPRGYPRNCRSDYNYNLYNFNNPTEAQIDAFIKERTPWMWLQTMENLVNPSVNTSLAGVNNLLYTQQSYTFTPPSSNSSLVRAVL